MKTVKLFFISNTQIEIPAELKKQINEHFKSQNIKTEFCTGIRGGTLLDKLANVLDKLEVRDTTDRVKICKAIWGDYDYSISRCFDVYLSKYRKQTSNKTFIMRKGIIERTL